MRGQSYRSGVSLVGTLVGTAMTKLKHVPWDLTRRWLTKAAPVNSICSIAVDTFTLFTALLQQLQVSFGMLLQYTSIVGKFFGCQRIVREPINGFPSDIEMNSFDTRSFHGAGSFRRGIPYEFVHPAQTQ